MYVSVIILKHNSTVNKILHGREMKIFREIYVSLSTLLTRID